MAAAAAAAAVAVEVEPASCQDAKVSSTKALSSVAKHTTSSTRNNIHVRPAGSFSCAMCSCMMHACARVCALFVCVFSTCSTRSLLLRPPLP